MVAATGKESGEKPWEPPRGYEIKPVPSVWSYAFFLPILLENRSTQLSLWCLLVPAIIWLGITIGVEIIFIYYLRELTCGDYEDDVDVIATPPCLRILCVSVLVATVGGKDVSDAIEMFKYIRCLKHDDSEFTIMNDGSTDGGISMMYRIYSIIVFVFGRLSLAVGLLYYAAEHLLQSQTIEDILLNAVAMTFVIDLDDVFYIVSVPRHWKAVLDAMPGPQDDENRVTAVCEQFLRGFLSLLVFCLTTAGLVLESQWQYCILGSLAALTMCWLCASACGADGTFSADRAFMEDDESEERQSLTRQSEE